MALKNCPLPIDYPLGANINTIGIVQRVQMNNFLLKSVVDFCCLSVHGGLRIADIHSAKNTKNQTPLTGFASLFERQPGYKMMNQNISGGSDF